MSPLPIPQECLHFTVSLLKASFHGNEQHEGMELCNLQRDVPSVQCKGTDGAHTSSRPCHNTAMAGTANAEPTGTDMKQAEVSSYLHYLHLRVIPDLLFHPYSVSGGNTLFPCFFLLSLSSDVHTSSWMVPCQRTPELLYFATSYQFMHALEFTFRRLHWHKEGEKVLYKKKRI